MNIKSWWKVLRNQLVRTGKEKERRGERNPPVSLRRNQATWNEVKLDSLRT
jgi:hypothetical protein